MNIVYQQIGKLQLNGQIPWNKNLPRLNHEKLENPHRPVTSKKIESVIKIIPTAEKMPWPCSFTTESYQMFKGNLIPSLKLV